MDTRKCAVCEVEFDFDKTGLQGPNGVLVCGTECAKKSAASRGHKHAIHDESGDIIATDAEPEDGPHLW
jgi:hypothetical protein